MENFIGFLVLGVIYFGFVSKGINSAAGLIQRERSMITSFHFPKASLVASMITKQFIDNLPPALLAIVIALLFQAHKTPSLTVFLVLPIYVLMHIFVAGLQLIIARATAFIPDLKGLVNLTTRALFFLSGVFFSVSRFDAEPTIKLIVELNPIYLFLSTIRGCVLDGTIPSIGASAYLIAWSAILIIFGFIYFWRAEARYASVR